MRTALFPCALVVLFCSGLATPAMADSVPPGAHPPHPAAAASAGSPPRLDPSALYSRRSRRLVQSYLRLKLMEARMADLERARLVIERKLGIRALLGETPAPIAR